MLPNFVEGEMRMKQDVGDCAQVYHPPVTRLDLLVYQWIRIVVTPFIIVVSPPVVGLTLIHNGYWLESF